jgi:hypothetical protein
MREFIDAEGVVDPYLPGDAMPPLNTFFYVNKGGRQGRCIFFFFNNLIK